MAYRISSNQEGVPKGKIRFEFDIYIDGKRHRRTQTCQKSAANALYKRWEKRLIEEPEGNFTLFEMLDEYLNCSKESKSPLMFKHEKMIIDEVVKRFFHKDMLLRDVKRSLVDDFIVWRRSHVVSIYDNTKAGGRVSDATVNRTIAVLSYFFNWTIRKGYFHDVNPFYLAKLREVNRREVNLTAENIEELLNKAFQQDESLFQIISIALLSGMRRSEIFSLKWSEVNFDALCIQLSQYKTKSKRGRAIPIIPDLKDILLLMKNNNPLGDKVITGMTPDMLHKQWNKLRTQVSFGKLDDGTWLRFHDLRHLCAQHYLNNGISLEDIQTLLGHESVTTTQQRYAQFSRPDLLAKLSGIASIVRLQRKTG